MYLKKLPEKLKNTTIKVGSLCPYHVDSFYLKKREAVRRRRRGQKVTCRT